MVCAITISIPVAIVERCPQEEKDVVAREVAQLVLTIVRLIV